MPARDMTEGGRLTEAGEQMPAGGGILLSAQQVASAPADVRNWLLRSLFQIETLEDNFVLEQNGVVTSGQGLAICSFLEIKEIIRSLADDYIALQVFFQLGCDYQNRTTGERRPYLLRLSDFQRHTDVDGLQRLQRCIRDINEAVQKLRGDPNGTLCRIDAQDLFHVHEMTQHRIYHFWLRLATLATKHPDVSPLPTRLARSLDASLGAARTAAAIRGTIDLDEQQHPTVAVAATTNTS